MPPTPDIALDARARLGEGALWHDGRLLWVDIQRGEVHRFDPATGHDERRRLGETVGTVVPRESGGILAAVDRRIVAVGCTPDDLNAGDAATLAEPEQDLPGNRFNDGKCCPAGRFFVGSMAKDTAPGAGSLYRLDPDRSVTRVLEGATISNGLVWSADHERMYYIDTPTRRIDAFDYDIETGALANRRPLCEIPDGLGDPDGMTIDADGHLWVCMWGGSRVTRWSTKTGRLLGEIPLPVENPTSCAFGGPDLRDLYITTANVGDAGWDSQPAPAGALFVCRPGPEGLPSTPFAG